MADSDEYFSDDFILDESALALLDQEEQKFTMSTQTQKTIPVSVPTATPPPMKRQKTDTGWKGVQRTETLDDMDDMPEIVVQGDGLYSLSARHAATHIQSTISGNHPAVKSRVTAPVEVAAPSIQRRTVSSSSSGPSGSQQKRHVIYNRPPPLQRQPSHSNSGFSRSHSAQSLSLSQNRPSQRPATDVRREVEPAEIEHLKMKMEEVIVNPKLIKPSINIRSSCAKITKGYKVLFKTPLIRGELKKGRYLF